MCPLGAYPPIHGEGFGKVWIAFRCGASCSVSELRAGCKVHPIYKSWDLGFQDLAHPREIRSCSLEISNVSAKLFGKPNMLTEDAANLLASIVAGSDEVIISKDLNGIITTWNDGARRVFGYSAEEIVGKSILLLIPEDLRQEEDHILAKIRAGERVERLETTRIRNSGERFSISITVSPIRDKTGRIIGASKVGRDISERLRADEHRARLAAIVDSADDAIIAKNLNGIITSWNRAACFLFGYTEDEIIGKSILILIPEDLHYEEEEILRKLRAGQKIDHYETTRVAKDGTRLEVSVTISPLRNRFGESIEAGQSLILLLDETAVHHAFRGRRVRLGLRRDNAVVAIQPVLGAVVERETVLKLFGNRSVGRAGALVRFGLCRWRGRGRCTVVLRRGLRKGSR